MPYTKIAIMGIGRMGRRHAQIIKKMRLDLVGICDQSLETLRFAGTELRIPTDRQFQSANEMLKKKKPECVIIATTAPAHCLYTCLAAEMGAKTILCEKPMGVSLKECDRMIRTCKVYGTRLAINHQMRFMEQYTEPKKIINSYEFGGLGSITVVGGNFGMAMNGIHYFEMFRYMTDEKPYEVTAWFSPEKVPNPRGKQFEDRAGSIRVVTKSGKRLYMEISADQGHGVKVIYSGRYGQILVDELNGTIRTDMRCKRHRDLPTTHYGMLGVQTLKKIAPAGVLGPSKAVLEALLEGKNYPTGEEGRSVVATLVAAYASHEQGYKPVKINVHSFGHRSFPWA